MNLSEQEYQLIQKFLSDNLTDTESLTFKSKLEIELFRKELEYQAKMIDTLVDLDKQNLKSQLHTENSLSETPVRRFRFSSVLKYAAILFIIGGLWFGFKDVLFKNNISNILVEHTSAYPPENFQRGTQAQLSKKYKEAMTYYANQNYELANNLFLDINPQNGEIILYRANCLIEIGKYDDAITLLNSISNTTNIKLKENAEWYLVVSHLSKENMDEGKRILNLIAKNPDHLFFKKAKKLISDL